MRYDFILPFAAIGLGFWLLQQYVLQQSMADEGITPDEGYYPDAPMSASIEFQTTVPYMQFAPSQLQTSANARAAIEQIEGRAYTAYQDPPGSGKFSIGVGHHITGLDGLTPLSVLDDGRIDAIFSTDLGNAENAIRRRVSVPLTQGQFDALVDFIFNLGETKFAGSTLLQYLNARNYAAAANEFKRWVISAGAVNPNLVARRKTDLQLFTG